MQKYSLVKRREKETTFIYNLRKEEGHFSKWLNCYRGLIEVSCSIVNQGLNLLNFLHQRFAQPQYAVDNGTCRKFTGRVKVYWLLCL